MTKGPNTYKGPIGSKLTGCEKLPVVPFQKIECNLSSVNILDLSKDQKYMLEISRVIQSGICPDDLSVHDPGPICHARWLTTAN